jgi:hypothetical protein
MICHEGGGGRRRRLRRPVHRVDNVTTFMCQVSKIPGCISLLEPSGPAQACTEIVLSLLLTVNTLHFFVSYVTVSCASINFLYYRAFETV